MPKASFTAPQVSTQAFVPPVLNPVKQTPKISDLVNDPDVVSAEPTQTTSPSTPTVSTSSSSSDTSAEMPTENGVTESSESHCDESASATVDEDFETVWNTMFDLLFAKIATVYYPLKGVIPQLKNNVIYVTVKNELMKENYEPQIRLALEYLRNNYNPQIDNIVVRVEEVKEEKSTLIYDTQDKMNDLRRENPAIPEFLRILNLSAKDM